RCFPRPPGDTMRSLGTTVGAGRGVQPAPGMKWGKSDVACERRSVGPVESVRPRRPSVLRLLRLPKVAPQACVRGDFAPGRTSIQLRAVSRLQRRVRVRRCRHPRPLAAPVGAVHAEGIAPAAVRWPRAWRTGCFDGAPLWGGPDWVPRGASL